MATFALNLFLPKSYIAHKPPLEPIDLVELARKFSGNDLVQIGYYDCLRNSHPHYLGRLSNSTEYESAPYYPYFLFISRNGTITVFDKKPTLENMTSFLNQMISS